MAASKIIDHEMLIRQADQSHYHYGPAMSRLLSLVSGVSESTIRQTKIYSRQPLRYIPMYPAIKGGGAITLGNKRWTSITYTENFFSTNQQRYGSAAYGNNLNVWLRLSAHEVGHLHHAKRFKSFLIYLIVFAYQYIRFGHDAAPLELEADVGPKVLSKFRHFIRDTFDQDLIHDCLETHLPSDEKLAMINQWWAAWEGERA